MADDLMSRDDGQTGGARPSASSSPVWQTPQAATWIMLAGSGGWVVKPA